MPYTVLVSVEGVIAQDEEQLARAQIIPEGLALFHALSEAFIVILSSVEPEYKTAERWLRECRIRPEQYRLLLTGEYGYTPDSIRKRHFGVARRTGDLRYVLDADPEVARWVIARGVTALCCPSPAYSRHSFLPDSQVGEVSWDQIVAEQTSQQAQRAEDHRDEELDDDDGIEEL